MSLKIKLVSLVSMFILVVIFLFVGVFALPQSEITLGGSINFEASGIKAKITGSISGLKEGERILNDLYFPESLNESGTGNQLNSWQNLVLDFKTMDNYQPITIDVTIQNLGEENLYVLAEELAGKIDNIYKNIKTNEFSDASGLNIELLPTNSITYTISFSISELSNRVVDAAFNYVFHLSETAMENKINISSDSNYSNLGTTTITGGENVQIGDIIQLSASPAEGYNFMGWATSLNPSDMRIVSFDQNYSFEYNSNSPRQYFALFNEILEEKKYYQDENYKYEIYEQAKIAYVSALADSSNVPSSVVIPQTISSNTYTVVGINDGFLQSKSEVTSLELPESIVKIGGASLLSLSITELIIPSGILEIGEASFSMCPTLANIKFSNNEKETEKFIVTGNALVSKSDDGGLNSIIALENGAFTPGQKITLPKAKKIGMYALGYTLDLGGIIISNTIEEIGAYAFYACGMNREEFTVEFESGNEVLKELGSSNLDLGISPFYYLPSLKSLELADSIEKIYTYAFVDCPALTTLTLGTKINFIGSQAFYNTSLTTLTINATVPPTIEAESIPSSVTAIYVPADSVSVYQSAWASYITDTNIIQAIP